MTEVNFKLGLLDSSLAIYIHCSVIPFYVTEVMFHSVFSSFGTG